MISKTKFVVYIMFLTCLALWLGSGVYHSILTTSTWYSDPLQYVSHLKNHSLPGGINPFPVLVALLALTTIPCFILFIGYNGTGRFEALSSITGTLILIGITAIYFVPGLENILADPAVYSDAELISSSRQWLILNIVRLFLVMGLFITGLTGLAKFQKLKPPLNSQ